MAARYRPLAPYGTPAVVTGGARLLAWCKANQPDPEKIAAEAAKAASMYRRAMALPVEPVRMYRQVMR